MSVTLELLKLMEVPVPLASGLINIFDPAPNNRTVLPASHDKSCLSVPVESLIQYPKVLLRTI